MKFGVLCWFSAGHLIAGVRHGKSLLFGSGRNPVAQELELLGHPFIAGLS